MKKQRRWFFILLVTLLGLLSTHLQAQQPGSIDTSLNAGPITFGGTLPSVGTMLLEPDGKIYIAGNFSHVGGVNRVRLARLLPNGQVDLTFDPGFSTDGSINSLARQADGKLLVSGTFTNFNGIRQERIARIGYDGNVDLTFNQGTGANSTITEVLVQPDGKLMIVGNFGAVGTTWRARVARLNEDGTLDPTFDPGTGINSFGFSSVGALAFHQDHILIGGGFTNYNGIRCTNLIRVSSTGVRDQSFAPLITGTIVPAVYSIAVQSDDKIVIGGSFHFVNGVGRTNIARLHSDGTLDLSFNPGSGASSTVQKTLTQSDGKVLIAGAFNSVSGITRAGVARLNEDGSLDTSFVFTPQTTWSGVNDLKVQSDGKLLVGGPLITSSPARTNVLRLIGNAPITTPPTITVPPRDQTAVEGQTPALSVIAEGYPLTYRWLFNEAPLPSATNAVLSFTNVTTNQAGNYFVVVSNSFGSITSAVATLTINETAPAFVRHPISLTQTAGTSTSLFAVAVGLPNYQWFHNGEPIANATSSSLSLPSLTGANSGNYWVIASNTLGTATSRTSLVTVIETSPQINTHPTSRTVLTGGKASFTAASSGSPTPAIQWQKNGANIAGATTTLLSFASVTTNDSGNFTLMATNYLGAVTSQVAVLQVLPPQPLSGSWYSPASLEWTTAGDAPWIVQSNTTFDGGDAAESAILASGNQSYLDTEVVGPGVLTFWWKVSSRAAFDKLEFYTNGVLRLNISGERNWEQVSFEIGAGTNRLRWRYVTSAASPQGQNRGWLDQISFNSLSQAIFTTHPRDTAVLENGYVQLQGNATGSAPIHYQWLFDGSIIPSATDRTLLLTNFSTNQSGTYTLRAANEFGTAYSSNAVLTLRPLLQSDAMQVLWRKAAGSAPWLPVESNHSYRGIAFNPHTTKALVVSRHPSAVIHVLNGDNGEEVGSLQTAGVVSGGTFTLNMVGVADDGAVYAANLTTSSRTSPLKIYRWENDSTNTVPILVWSGDPGAGTGATRWGDSMDVRGAGANTELLFGSGTSSPPAADQIAIIRPDAGITSPAKTFDLGFLSQSIHVGFGAEDSVWFRLGLNLYHASMAGETLSDVQNYTNAMSSAAAFAVDNQSQLIARLMMDSPDYVQLSRLALPALNPVDSKFVLHPLDYTNSFQVGSVSFKGDRVYAINANNGILALQILPTLQLTISNDLIMLDWKEDHILQSADDVDGPFADVAFATRPFSVQPSEERKFFRLRRSNSF